MAIHSKESTPPPTIGKIGPYTVFLTPPPTTSSPLPVKSPASPPVQQHSPPVQQHSPPVQARTPPPPVQPPPQQFYETPDQSSEGSVLGFLRNAVVKVQNAHSSLDEYVAHWFGLNQSKYQWALDDYYETKGGDQAEAKAAKNISCKAQSV